MMQILNRRPDALVVHRDSGAAADVVELLRDAGYHVIEAGSYYEGRRLLSTELPRLLIADVRLGDYNGLNLAWHRESTFPGPTIITDAAHDSVLEADAAKMNAVYVGPARARVILSLSRQFLGTPVLGDDTIRPALHERTQAVSDFSETRFQ
jgi:DNA-binding NtrC family response regulator